MIIKSGIYCIKCIPTTKIYIGSSKDTQSRWISHRGDLRGNRHYNTYLQNAWNKYGEKNFEFSVMEEVNNLDLLIEREQWWLDNTGCCNKETGFNQSKTAVGKPKDNISTNFKKWIIRLPNYMEIEIENLKKFARENNLNYDAIKSAAEAKRREYKNYHVREVGVSIEDWVKRYVSRGNRKCKFWIATNISTGKETFVTCMQNFCKINDLNKGSICSIAHGTHDKHRGWHARPADMSMSEWQEIREFKRSKKERIILWKCISPTGEENETTNLRQFCIKNNLGYSSMKNLGSGLYYCDNYKGWKCERIGRIR